MSIEGVSLPKMSVSVHVDMSEAWNTVISYPYNIIAGAAAVGTAVLIIRKYFGGAVCKSKAKLVHKTVIITGGNTGIGKETAIDLAKRKAKVILACRNPERGRKAEEEIRKKSGNENVVYRHLDLASLASVREFAEGVLQDEPHIDILINNAGIMACPYWKTEDGFEMQFGVNHLGHFLLTNLLLDKLKEAPSARVINVSSLAYKRVKGINFDDINSEESYDPQIAYGHSKLANILFTRALSKRLEGTGVTVNCLHPGVIWTELGRHIMKKMGLIKKLLVLPIILLAFKTPHEGAQTTIYCAVSHDLEGVSGEYFGECRLEKLQTEAAKDDEAAERLWRMSANMVGLGYKSSD